ncbi:MAG: DUF4912 domain-containing protein [Chthoniobacterales bacterium]|nr:DUF4912 domain-containing protein [Chthoniobacterales bacterium]
MKKKTKKKTAVTKAKGAAKTTAKAPPKKRAAVSEDVHQFEAARPEAKRRAGAAARGARGGRKGADIDNLGDLPRGYGDDRIFVVAQEPHWLFCYWDYTLTENALGAVFLRHGRDGRQPEGEAAVPRETNSWYLSVRDADADYAVELGCYVDGDWKTLTRSGVVLTPRDTLAGLGEPLFANMPFHVTFQELVEKLRGKMRQGESLAEALARLQQRGDMPVSHLNSAQRIALDTLLRTDLGSLTSGDLGRFLSSPGAGLLSGRFGPGSWGGGASWSSASRSGAVTSWAAAAMSSRGAESGALSSWGQAPREFFMHVNAEVIFYGGTHPDAKVTVDGKPVTLRPDGTFRYHFVLPDGEFEVPLVATSPDGVETRRAVLKFERATARSGEVGATAQPPLGAPIGRKKPQVSLPSPRPGV